MSQANTIIRASAGTGKTFQLSNRFLKLLLQGAAADEILATTFTRKAAGEILDRVVGRLAEAAVQPEACTRLAQELDEPALTRAHCLDALRGLLAKLHRLKICTLDSYFSKLAGSFSLELGLPPGWRIIEELHDRRLRSESIETLLTDPQTSDLDRMIQMVTKGDADRSVSELISTTVGSLYKLYLQTDEQAWQRLPQRKPLTSEQLNEAIERLENAPLPNDKRFESGRDANVQQARLGDWETFISNGLAAKILNGEQTYHKKPFGAELEAAYQELLKHARAVLIGQLASQTAATYQLLDRFHRTYHPHKLRHRAVQFEDVTHNLAQFNQVCSADQQRYRLDSPTEHVLLDEFQDTSLPQWQVLRPLVHAVTGKASGKKREARSEWRGASGERQGGVRASSPLPSPLTTRHSPLTTHHSGTFFCVGDVKQAIYGWRGGQAEIFNVVEQEIPGTVSLPLNRSFRSAPAIIDVVNRVFTGLAHHQQLGDCQQPVEQWCRSFPKHTTERSELPGFVELVSSRMAAGDETPEEAHLKFTAERIERLVRQHPGWRIGVLMRKNKSVARLVYELQQRRVRASEEGGNPLTDSAAVLVVLAALTLADHPGDTVARFHVATSPLAELFQLADYRDSRRCNRVARELRRELVQNGYGPTVDRLAQQLMPHVLRRDRSRLQQLVDAAYAYEPLATLRPRDFCRHIQWSRVGDPLAVDVSVTTIHQAKGLQYDVVVLPELDANIRGQNPPCVVGYPNPAEPPDRVCIYRKKEIQALLPSSFRQAFTESLRRDVTETMCTMYVALTRAIHALHLLIRPSKPNENKLPSTLSGLLRAALTDGRQLEPECVVYTHGRRDWHYGLTPPSRRRQPEAADEPQPIRFTGRRKAALEHATPSGLEGGGYVPVDRVLELESAASLARGSLLHAWFETLTWLDDGPPDEQTLRRVADQLDTRQVNVAEQRKWFQKLLDDSRIATLFRRDYYAQPSDPTLRRILTPLQKQGPLQAMVANERRFAVRIDNQLLSGSIDRFVLLYDRSKLVAAHVIDFKTDAIDRAGSSDYRSRVDHYRPQLEAYRRAVARLYDLPAGRIAAHLVFLATRTTAVVFDE